MNFTIRNAEQTDAPRVAELFDLYRQFYDQAPDAVRALDFIGQRLARSESVILVAERDGHGLVGFCQMYPSFCSVEAAPIGVLYDLFVVPTARQRGVARGLLLAAEQRALADGQVRMDLTTARTNRAAQSLYEAMGWVRDEVFLTYNRRPLG